MYGRPFPSWGSHNIVESNKELYCSDLARDDLTTLLVWVDKKNLMEFSLNFLYYLYNYCMVCAPSSHSPHVT